MFSAAHPRKSPTPKVRRLTSLRFVPANHGALRNGTINVMPPRQLLLIVAIAGAFGVLVPYYKGYGFLDRRLIVAYACLAAVFAGPTATDAFAPDEQDHALRKMARVWLLSWGFAALLLTLALVTVNLTNRHVRPLVPRTSFLIAGRVFGSDGIRGYYGIGRLSHPQTLGGPGNGNPSYCVPDRHCGVLPSRSVFDALPGI